MHIAEKLKSLDSEIVKCFNRLEKTNLISCCFHHDQLLFCALI